MKKVITLSIGIFLISFSFLIASTTETTNNNLNPNFINYGNSYIFTVQNVEFSVFPDGQFDFTYLENNSPNINISYNAGYNYEMYVQYDMYGGVIQVENVPIYYDEFGRVSQVGTINIYYNRNRVTRIGGLYIHYNRYGYYAYSSGFINAFNYHYTYRPWHSYYIRPAYTNCLVYNYPYRRNYVPTRYSYTVHHNYYRNRGRNNNTYANGRRNFDRPGRYNHYKGGRYEVNKNYQPSRRKTSVAVASKPIINRTRPVYHTKPITNNQNPRRNRLVNNLNTKPTVTGSHRFRGNRNTILNGRKVSSQTNMNPQNRTTRYSSSKTSNIASNTKRSQQVNSNTTLSRKRSRGLY